MSELFDLPESKSPRLQWLEQHGLVLRKKGEHYECVMDDENKGTGDDADDACVDLCLNTGLRHWNGI